MSKESWISRYWNGHAPLWKAFWLVGLLGQVIASVAAAVMMFALRSFIGPLLAYALWTLVILGAAVFACVSVWRNANNTKLPQLGALAKVLVVFYLGAWLLLVIRLNSTG